MSFDAAQALVAADLAAVELAMLRKMGGHYGPLADTLTGLIRSGGKRVRPTLALLAGRLHPPPQPHPLISLAAAVEALHTATLVHDDVIDGALLRRGQSTLNARWTPSSTIMAGDFFFARAAALAAETEHPRVIQLFAETLNVIVDGELRQAFTARDWGQPKQSYYDRIYGKTAALFEVATRAPALLANAPAAAEEALRAYGYHLGMAFQIVDDLLDFVADASTLGKPAGSDLQSGIITLPVYYYIQDPDRRDQLVALVDGQRHGEDVVAEVVRMIRASDAIAQTKAEALRFAEAAIASLASYADAAPRQALTAIARYVVEREF
ncbi:MAG: polyprenyl synthetase family protein [Caldilineales bacterium]|nr:polyprenyl synthetase family protein [Caldilineales bacterium]